MPLIPPKENNGEIGGQKIITVFYCLAFGSGQKGTSLTISFVFGSAGIESGVHAVIFSANCTKTVTFSLSWFFACNNCKYSVLLAFRQISFYNENTKRQGQENQNGGSSDRRPDL